MLLRRSARRNRISIYSLKQASGRKSASRAFTTIQHVLLWGSIASLVLIDFVLSEPTDETLIPSAVLVIFSVRYIVRPFVFAVLT